MVDKVPPCFSSMQRGATFLQNRIGLIRSTQIFCDRSKRFLSATRQAKGRPALKLTADWKML